MLCHRHLVTIYSEVWSLLQNQELSMKQYNRTSDSCERSYCCGCTYYTVTCGVDCMYTIGGVNMGVK